MGVTDTVVKFVLQTTYEDLPAAVINKAKISVIDWLGSAIRASQETSVKLLQEVLDVTKAEEATIIMGRGKKSCIHAALVNGVMGHTLEMDDLHPTSVTHPAASVIPAALSICELVKADGKDLILAIVLGYEVEIRVAEAVMPSHYRFWHTTATCGTFGATVAAGKLLRLNPQEMVNALGVAETQAAGLISAFGTLSKPLQVGKAAFNGVLSALLAQRGFTGPSEVLEDKNGFLYATSKDCNPLKIVDGLGGSFRIMDTAYKVHASCGHSHGAIDAVLQMKKNFGLKPDDVKEILIKTYPTARELMGRIVEPHTSHEAKFSLPYCVAAALIFGRASLEEFIPEKLSDKRVLQIAKRVKVEGDPNLTEVPLGYSEVEVVMKNGDKYTLQVSTPRGHPDNPITADEIKSKFSQMVSPVISRKKVQEILHIVEGLEHLRDVNLLTRLLRADRGVSTLGSSKVDRHSSP